MITLCCWCDSPATTRLDDDPACPSHADEYHATYRPHFVADFRLYRTWLDERYPAPPAATVTDLDALATHYAWIDDTAARLSAVDRLTTRNRITEAKS